jgi:FkbM family methyltransferase
MISYAQNFEDVMLARVVGGRTDGFYVDVGAGDPVEMSVTKWFYDLGWSGINIEPNPVFHQKLVAERARDINLKCGAGAFDGEAQYFQLPANELSSFDPEIRAHAEAAGTPVVSMTAAVLRLTTILDRHADERPIDFLKIDVEGWEREVLTGLDLQRYRPTVIVVEATLPTTRVEAHSKWESLLSEADYSAVHFDGLSQFYLPNERMDLKVHFQLPPNVFDDIKTWPHAASEIGISQLRADLDRVNSDLRRAQTACNEMEREIAYVHGEAEARLNVIKRLHAELERYCDEKDRHIASLHGEAEARLNIINRLDADLRSALARVQDLEK